MSRALTLVALFMAIAGLSAPQAGAKEGEICVHVNDRYRHAAVTCGCPTITERVVKIPSFLCTSTGQWRVQPEGCGTVSFNSNVEAMHFYLRLRKASKC